MAENLTYGFVDYEHSTNEAITTIGEQAIYDAVIESARFHSEQIQKILSGLVTVSTVWQELVKIPSEADLQPVSDLTQPDPIRFLGQYSQGYPIQKAGIAFGLDRVSKHTMTVGDANRQTLQMLKADAKWMKRHILGALFTKDSYTFTDKVHGALTVQPLANGDTVKYQKKNGAYETANHYLGYANAIDDGADNPFPAIHTLLTAYDSANGKPIITYIHDDQMASIKALATFVAVPDTAIIQSISSDTLNTSQIPDPGIGEEIIGRADGHWICRCAAIPSGYMLSCVVGMEMPVVQQRNMPVPALQGLFEEQANVDGNLSKLSLIRYAGFGVKNRIGAVCTKIGNGTYSAPSDYTTVPLAA